MKKHKIDLHIHSPSSFDSKNSSLSFEEWSKKIKIILLKHGISIIAITDHDYFDIILYEKFKKWFAPEILVLPGIEIKTYYGEIENTFDTLVIASETNGTKLIEKIYELHESSKCEYDNESRKLSDNSMEKYKRNKISFDEIKSLVNSDEYKSHGFLMPHYNKGSNNLLEALKKHFNSNWNQIKSFVNTNLTIVEESKSSHKEFQKQGVPISSVYFSDNHDISIYPDALNRDKLCRIRELPTFIINKSFESILYAISSPETRISSSINEIKISNNTKNIINSVKFIDIKTKETKEEFELSPNSNAIIGERGTGKTNLFLQILKGIDSENPEIHNPLKKYDSYKNYEVVLETNDGSKITPNEIIFLTQNELSDIQNNFLSVNKQTKQAQQKIMNFLSSKNIKEEIIKTPKEVKEILINIKEKISFLENIEINGFNDNKLKISNFAGEISKSLVFANKFFDSFLVQQKKGLIKLSSYVKDIYVFLNMLIKSISNTDEQKEKILKHSYVSLELQTHLTNNLIFSPSVNSLIEILKNEKEKMNRKIAVIETLLIKKSLFNFKKDDKLLANIQNILTNNLVKTNKNIHLYLDLASQIRDSIKLLSENKYKYYDETLSKDTLSIYKFNSINIDVLIAWSKKLGNNINQLTDSLDKEKSVEKIIKEINDNPKNKTISLFNSPNNKYEEEKTDIIIKIQELNAEGKVIDKFINFFESSPGQRSASIIKLLLEKHKNTKSIIFLDQPEDNMDNKTIYYSIVKLIKENKYKWQLIVVTHNAQIVINGDIDKYIVTEMKNKDNKNLVSIKEIKYVEESIRESKFISMLEGSETAMKQRFKKYNINSSITDTIEKKTSKEIYEGIRK